MTTGTSQTLSMEEAIKLLQKIQNNYRRYYSNLKREEAQSLGEIWVEGLQKIEGMYAQQALNYYIAKAREYKIAYERKNPVIRNSWEIKE